MKKEEKEKTYSKPEVSDIMVHENGLQYKEIGFTEGVTIKLFNTNKPQRLEVESQMEYRIRRKLNNNQLREFLNGTPFYHSDSRVPYVKTKEVNTLESTTKGE